ncbi:MAG: 50S ribosomal protein L24 [Patescibacteria group bacterium]
MKIRKGDTVKIMKGKDRGKTGKVSYVNLDAMKITVEGLNMFKKHKKPRKQGEKGQIVEVARPINQSNVQFVCPTCNNAVRIGVQEKDGKRVRYCKKCKNILEK